MPPACHRALRYWMGCRCRAESGSGASGKRDAAVELAHNLAAVTSGEFDIKQVGLVRLESHSQVALVADWPEIAAVPVAGSLPTVDGVPAWRNMGGEHGIGGSHLGVRLGVTPSRFRGYRHVAPRSLDVPGSSDKRLIDEQAA